MSDDFRTFNIHFTQFGYHLKSCECEECDNRRDGRWLLRGALMFNDMELADDPWNYDNPKNR